MNKILLTLTCLFLCIFCFSQSYELNIDGDINFTGQLYKNGSLLGVPTVNAGLSSTPNTLVERNNNGWIFQNKIYLTQNTTTSYTGGPPSSSSLYSTIYRNPDPDREELLLNGGTASYGSGHNGASIHVHGNEDDQHPGAFAILTGGLGRLLINKFGEIAVGGQSYPADHLSSNIINYSTVMNDPNLTCDDINNLYHYLDNGQECANHATGKEHAMDGVFNIWRPQGKPALYIEGAGPTEGDIAWKDGENFDMGVWDNDGVSSSFTGLVKIKTNGDLELLTGDAYKTGGGSWSVLSDARLKKDVKPFNDGLKEVLKINPVRFKYNSKSGIKNLNKEYIGVLAQDLLEVAPYMVKEDNILHKVEGNTKKTYYTVDPSALDYILINAIKEQQVMIDNQQKTIIKLQKDILQIQDNNTATTNRN